MDLTSKISVTVLVLSIQDLSYYCCIELQGEEDKLLASLSQLTSKEAGENTDILSSFTHKYWECGPIFPHLSFLCGF